MFISTSDQGLGLILPTELKEFLSEVKARLGVAGGDGRINQIEAEANKALASFRSEMRFDDSELGVAERLMRAAISEERSNWDCEE